MKRLSVVFLIFSLLQTLNIFAQQETIEGGEAFYIWQNDGHFDGFFYDQVQEIRYSRFDTLGVEHDDYVSQEVVTADSTYRIMLTAIDSVSFVQPEIRFAKAMRFMRDEGLMDYYQSMVKAGEKFTLTFSGAIPTALRPKVGDVLSCPNLPDYDQAFVGKVSRVTSSGGNLVVECGYVDKLSDVFEQFITVEQVRQVQTPEGSSTRRRIAGFDAPKRIEGNINDFTLFNFNATLEGNILLREKLRLGLTLNVGFGMTVSAVYKLTWTEIYVKTEMKEQIALGASVSLDGELASTDDLSALPGAGALVKRFSKVPFPAHFPILYINVLPIPFSRIDAHVKASLNLGVQVKSLTQSFELSETWPYIRIKLGFLPLPILPLSFEPSGTFNLTAEINGLAQTGIKFPLEMGTEEWMKLLVETKGSVNVYAGPKISGALTFDIGKYLKEHKGAYENLKDTKVDLSLMSIDTEFKVEGSIGKKKAEAKHTESVAYGTYTLHLFPDITDVTFDVSGNLGDVVTAKFKTSGDVFVPQSIGFGLYTQDQNEEYTVLGRRMYRDETYFLNTFNEVELTMENIAPGKYVLRPIILTPFGIVPLYKHEQPFTVAPRNMVIKPTEVTAEETGGEFVINITNTVDMPLSCSTDESWIHPEIQNRGTGGMVMVVKVDENNTDRYRTGIVTVRLRLSTTDTVEKELTVHQYGGLQISPKSLNYTKEGGAQTVDVLTSQHTITVNLNGADSWLSYRLDGRKITLTAKKNDGLQRTATVTISSYNPKHDGINAVDLKVSQEGADNVSLEKTEVTLESNGVSQRILTTNGSFTLSDAVVRKEYQDWLMVEKQASGVIVTATPNTTGKERTGYIDLTFTKKGEDGQNYKVVLPLKVTQKAGAAPSVNPTALTFDGGGGTQSITVYPQGYARRGFVIADADKSWLSAKNTENNTIQITALPNNTGKQRTSTIRCYVTNVENSTDAERVYLPVTITQKAGSASVSPSTLTFTTGGGTQKVTITATGYTSFGYNDTPSWLTAKIGTGNTIEFTATANTTGQERTYTVKCYVTNMDEPTEAQKVYLPVKVTQSGTAPSVSSTALTFEIAGGTKSVTVYPQGYARRGFVIADADKSWLSAKNASNNSIEITAQANNTGKERTATVRCYVTNVENSTDAQRVYMPVKVTQKAGSASISASELNFLKGGGTKTVTIKMTGYTNFGCDGAPSWLTLTPSSDGKISIVATENTTGSERTYTLKFWVANVANPTNAQKVYLPVKVTQSVTAPSVSPTSLTFNAAGGMQSVTVSLQGYARYGATFANTEDKSWISLKATNNTIEITTQANNTGKERTATVRCYVTNVQNSTDAQRVYMNVKVTQKADATPSVSPTSLTYEATGGTQSVTVYPQGYARKGYIIPDADKSWLSGEFGENNVIKFTAKANTTGKERSTTIRCYVTNVQNSTDAQRVYMNVKVTQKANSQTSVYRIESLWIHFDFSALLHYVVGNDSYDKEGYDNLAAGANNTHAKTEVVVTQDANGYHVKGSRNSTDSNGNTEISTISFDIDDLNKLDSKTAIISNVKCESKGIGNFGTAYWKVSSKSKLKMNGPLEDTDSYALTDGNRRVYRGEWECSGSQLVLDEFEYKMSGKNPITYNSSMPIYSKYLTVGVSVSKDQGIPK